MGNTPPGKKVPGSWSQDKLGEAADSVNSAPKVNTTNGTNGSSTQRICSTAWGSERSAELYRIDDWGAGYFGINKQGRVVVRPYSMRSDADSKPLNGPECDLFGLVESLVQRGITPPILFRFDGIIQDRVQVIQEAFNQAMREVSYRAQYHQVYSVKANQQRHIVEAVLQTESIRPVGVQVGSKPELVAMLAILDRPHALLICNGFKDDEYIELALLAQNLGRRVILIVEHLFELERIIDVAARLSTSFELGLRIKPSISGLYGESLINDKNKFKFGLGPNEVIQALAKLKSAKLESALKLLHFHIGTQITSIVPIKKVLREAARTYVELARLCPALSLFDVGGGLAVDYDGSQTNFNSSMNYSVEEYARDVVYAIEEACREAEIAHPDLVTESGRALVAHHAVLVAEVIDVAQSSADLEAVIAEPPSSDKALQRLYEMQRELCADNCIETLHDMLQLKDDIREMYMQGDLGLKERAYAEKLFKVILARVQRIAFELETPPDELEMLSSELRDMFFCNFSVFQSVPDSWAVNQLFPTMPVHLLNEPPQRKAVIVDLTCDGDGTLDHFIDLKDVCDHIYLHSTDLNSHYYVGVFLVGAYQEILGDLHNLFGDTHAVHVRLSADGQVQLAHMVEGDRIREVLSYVQYDAQDLQERLRVSVEQALDQGLLKPEEGVRIQKRYKEALEGYTYLVK